MVNSDTVIGRNSIVNTDVVIDHDCIVGVAVRIASGATLCGGVSIGDGASTDGAQDILNRHSATVSSMSERDRGIYAAMNKGIKLISGDVIGFLNADDVYAGPEVPAQMARIAAHEHLDALFGNVEFFKGENPGRSVCRYRSGRFHPKRIAWGMDACASHFIFAPPRV